MRNNSSSKIPRLFGFLVLSGFIIFPLTSMAVVFDMVTLDYFQNISLPILPKLYKFTDASSSDVVIQNARLWFVLFVPYILILIWFLLYSIIIYSNNAIICTGVNFLKNVKLYFMFLSILIFMSIVYATGDMRYSRFSGISPDYSLSMSISEYSNWQMQLYLFAAGLLAALEFLILTLVFLHREK